jgi:hypothetical protein
VDEGGHLLLRQVQDLGAGHRTRGVARKGKKDLVVGVERVRRRQPLKTYSQGRLPEQYLVLHRLVVKT